MLRKSCWYTLVVMLVTPTAYGFDVNFNFVNGSASVQAATQPFLDVASQFWESAIVGYQDGVQVTGIDVDVDLQLLFGATNVFGGFGVTGNSNVQSGFTFSTNADGTRSQGALFLNPMMYGNSLAQTAVNHELGHAMGFGALFVDNGVYVTDSGQYTGPNGLAAYQREFDAAATFVPIELDMFSGANFHLDETNSITDAFGRPLGNDLMTGILENNPAAIFLSRTSRSIFSDLGYRIAPICDFNGDANCDLTDIDLLVGLGPISAGVDAVLGTTDQFDITGDATIDNEDLDEWLATAAAENGFGSPYKTGDANLDGVVDGLDFIRWNENRFSSTLAWSNGNFNGDGIIDGQDFILWNDSKFTSSDVAVPEPHSAGALLACLTVFVLRYRRSSFGRG